MSDKGKIKKLIVIVSAITAGIALIIGGYMLWEKASGIRGKSETAQGMTVSQAPMAVSVTPQPDADIWPKSIAFDNASKDGVYTILLVGNDGGAGNTDTIMLGKIDTETHRMDFVSIPRDTYINEAWQVRKISCPARLSQDRNGAGDLSRKHPKHHQGGQYSLREYGYKPHG